MDRELQWRMRRPGNPCARWSIDKKKFLKEVVVLLRLDHGGIKILNVSILNPTMLAIGRSKFCSDPREMRRMSEMGRGAGRGGNI
jgi:hypothetical protein